MKEFNMKTFARQISPEYQEAAIVSIMGDRETVTEGATKASLKTVVSSRFDSSSFKKAYPDLFTEYSTATSYKRFTVV